MSKEALLHILALPPASAPQRTMLISIFQIEKLWPHGSHTRLISHQPGIQTQASGGSQLNVPVLPLTQGDEESPCSSLGLIFPILLSVMVPLLSWNPSLEEPASLSTSGWVGRHWGGGEKAAGSQGW